jgi:hypothetical protein
MVRRSAQIAIIGPCSRNSRINTHCGVTVHQQPAV